MCPMSRETQEPAMPNVPDLAEMIQKSQAERRARELLNEIQARIDTLPEENRAWVQAQMQRPAGEALHDLLHRHSPQQSELLRKHVSDYYGHLAPALVDFSQILLLAIIRREPRLFPDLSTILGQIVERAYALGYRRGCLDMEAGAMSLTNLAGIMAGLGDEGTVVEVGDGERCVHESESGPDGDTDTSRNP